MKNKCLQLVLNPTFGSVCEHSEALVMVLTQVRLSVKFPVRTTAQKLHQKVH